MADHSQLPSFKTDVHRAKTQRWAEAKSYAYDGDDWGNYDEYDEYGAEEEKAPLPQKPTDHRQPGQTLSPTTQTSSKFDNTARPSAPGGAERGKADSFDEGDDERTFANTSASRAGVAETVVQAPAILQAPSAQSGMPFGPLRSAMEQAIPTAQLKTLPIGLSTNLPSSMRASPILERGNIPLLQPSNSANNAENQYPAPSLQSQPGFSPVLSNSSGSSLNNRYPPRKSSLSRTSPSNSMNPSFDPPPPPTVPEHRTVVDENRQQSATETNTLKFIRPADIYKRMEMEREKERRSLDQTRPSMEAINRSESDGDIAPPAQQQSLQEQRRTSPSPSRSRSQSRHRQSPTRLKPALETVPERKSEYMSGFSVTNPALARALGADMVTSPPSLPQTHRVSAFGADLWSFTSSGQAPSTTAAPVLEESPDKHREMDDSRHTSELKHQPSNGFRTAVHGAFDGANDDPTLLSPNEYSEMSRSNTASTGRISPIIGRFPEVPPISERINEPSKQPGSSMNATFDSTAATMGSSHLPHETTPRHSRNVSSESTTYSQVTPKRPEIANASPTNSPARSPGIVKAMRFPEASVAEIAHAGGHNNDFSQDYHPPDHPGLAELPVREPDSDLHYESREADLPRELRFGSRNEVGGTTGTARRAPVGFLESRSVGEGREPPRLALRTASPSKGRVRDLASKYDGISEIARSPTPSSSVASWTGSEHSHDSPTSPSRTDVYNSTTPQASNRPLPVAAPSFVRPQIPGSWVSYAQSPRNSTPAAGRSEVDEDYYDSTPSKVTQTVHHQSPEDDVDLTPTTMKRRLPGKTFNQSSAHPLDSVAAAGHALAESLMASMGFREADKPESEPANEAEQRTPRLTAASSPDHSVEKVTDEPSSITSNLPSPPSHESNQQDSHPIAGKHLYTTVENNITPTTNYEQQPESHTHNSNASRRSSLKSWVEDDSEVEDSPETLESDRLRKDIVRSLTPSGPRNTEVHTVRSSPASRDSQGQDVGRGSTLIPHGYDSYWAATPQKDEFSSKRTSSHGQEEGPMIEPLKAGRPRSSVGQPQSLGQPSVPTQFSTTTPKASTTSPNFLGARFSWEGHHVPQGSAEPAFFDERSVDQRAERVDSDHATGIPRPESPHLRHDFRRIEPPATSTSPNPRDHNDLDAEDRQLHTYSPNPAAPTAQALPRSFEEQGIKANPLEQAAGLQGLGIISNFAPNRMHHDENRARSLPDESGEAEGLAELPDFGRPRNVHVPVSGPTTLPDAYLGDASDTGGRITSSSSLAPRDPVTPEGLSPIQSRGTPHRPKVVTSASMRGSQTNRSLTQPRLVTFKDFAAIKSTPQRIEAYDLTRKEYADQHTGLNDWLVHMVTAHPEHAHADVMPSRSNTHGGGLASTVGLGKLQAKLMRSGASAQPDDTYSAQAIQEDGRLQGLKGRQPSQQVQSKGNLLGGAKGLLAKGRNKLKGGNNDKAPTPPIPASPQLRGMQVSDTPLPHAGLGMTISSPTQFRHTDGLEIPGASSANRQLDSDASSLTDSRNTGETRGQSESTSYPQAHSPSTSDTETAKIVSANDVNPVAGFSELASDDRTHDPHARTSDHKILPKSSFSHDQTESIDQSDIFNDKHSDRSSGYFSNSVRLSLDRHSYPVYHSSQLAVKDGAYGGTSVLSPLTDYADEDSDPEDSAETPNVSFDEPTSTSNVGVFGARGYNLWQDTDIKNSGGLPSSLRDQFNHPEGSEETATLISNQAVGGLQERQSGSALRAEQSMTEKEVLPTVLSAHQATLARLERRTSVQKAIPGPRSRTPGITEDRPRSGVSNFSAPSNTTGGQVQSVKPKQSDIVSPMHSSHGSRPDLRPVIETGLEVVETQAHSQRTTAPLRSVSTSRPLTDQNPPDPRASPNEHSLPGIGPAPAVKPSPTRQTSRRFLSFGRSRSRDAVSDYPSLPGLGEDQMRPGREPGPLEADRRRRQDQCDAPIARQQDRATPSELSGENNASIGAVRRENSSQQLPVRTLTHKDAAKPARIQTPQQDLSKLQRGTTSSDSVDASKKRTSFLGSLFGRSKSSDGTVTNPKRAGKLSKNPPPPSPNLNNTRDPAFSGSQQRAPPVPAPSQQEFRPEPSAQYSYTSQTSLPNSPRPNEPVNSAHIQYLQSQGIVPQRYGSQPSSRSSTPSAGNPRTSQEPMPPLPAAGMSRQRGSPQQPYYSIFPQIASTPPMPNPRRSMSPRASVEASFLARSTPPPPQHTAFMPPATTGAPRRSQTLPLPINIVASNAYRPVMDPNGPAPPIPPRSPERTSMDAGRRRSGHERMSSVDSRIAEARQGRMGQGVHGGHQRHESVDEHGEEDDEEILMSPTSWPGMEWVPGK